jgi:hypothetical protein
MTHLFAALIAFFIALPAATPVLAQTPPVTAAQPTPDDRARQWLTLVDDSNYTEGVSQMGEQARTILMGQLPQIREPLGAMAGRNLKDITLPKTVPGMPAGQYAVVRYESRFANRATAIETVTLAMAKSGWAVVGYRVD